MQSKKIFRTKFLSKNIISAPFIKTEDQKKCVICESYKFQFFSSGYDFEIGTCSNKWFFQRCLKCNHVQLNPIPHKSALGIIYPKSYYSYSFTEKINPIIIKGKDFLDKKKIEGILKFVKLKVESYLDVGCGDGRYLKAIERICRISQKKIYGLELNKETSKLISRMGFNGINSSVEELSEIKSETISLITLFHVIEHTKNPKKVISKLRELLTPGGYLIIETPNLISIDAELFNQSYWGGYHFPRHWHLFRFETLSALLEKNGFKVERLTYHTGHSFWLYSIHHLLKYHYGFSMISKLFNPLRSKFFLILITIFDLIRSKLGFKTSSLMIIARKKEAL